MRTALVRLGPSLKSLKLLGSDAERCTVYANIRRLDRAEPVWVDHEPGEHGRVIDLFETDEVLLRRELQVPWWYAKVELGEGTDWVKKGTGASISTKAGYKSDVNGFEIRRDAFLHEVTLCLRKQPRQPHAMVLGVWDEPDQPSEPTRVVRQFDNAVRLVGDVQPHWLIGYRPRNGLEENAELHARLDRLYAANPDADMFPVLEDLKDDLGHTARDDAEFERSIAGLAPDAQARLRSQRLIEKQRTARAVEEARAHNEKLAYDLAA
jgi:hypothetical protein